jgi:hypothetical protein
MAKASGKSLDELFGGKGSSLEKLAQLKERGDRVGGGGGGNYFKLTEGTTEVRILPAINDEDAFYYATAYHYVNNKYVYCRKYLDEDASCPVCSHASKIWKKYKDTGDERIAEEAKSLFAKQQFIYNALVRNQEGDKVVVLQTGKGVKDDLIGVCLDDNYGDITNPVKGRDVGIRRKGKGKATSYQIMVRDRSILAGDESDPKEAAELISAILEKRKSLHELVKYPTEEEAEKEIKKYLDADSSGDADETPTPRKSNVAEAEEDSDEDKDTFDEIEKQLSAAKKKRGGK